MKLTIFNLQNQKTGEKDMPVQFTEPVRPDLIKKAILALQANARQKYGAKPEAGKRHSAELSRRRRKYRGAYGHGISRVTRKILTRRGTRFYWVAAVSPGTRGGRRAHPPKSEKKWEQKINKKENRKAIRSALAATLNKELVQERGHQIPENYPFLVDSEMEKLNKTKLVQDALKKLGFEAEMKRSLIKKIRAGIGKLRGRKYRRKKGLLIVVGEDCPLAKSGRNIPGIEVVTPNQLNAELLAPGKMVGRVTLYTENAINKLDKLFV